MVFKYHGKFSISLYHNSLVIFLDIFWGENYRKIRFDTMKL